MQDDNKNNPDDSKVKLALDIIKNADNKAKKRLIIEIYNTLPPDDMVEVTDFLNQTMQDVVSHKAEIAARIIGKKSGELFDFTKEKLNGLANQFSAKMRAHRGDRDKHSDIKNPYDEISDRHKNQNPEK